jgi:hypothetical protein
MAATFALRASGVGSFNPVKVPGALFDVLVEVSGDASYPAGGYPFLAAQLQATTGGVGNAIESVEVVNPWINTAANGTAYMAGWDKANNKIHAFAQAVAGGGTAQVDVTAATVMTGFVCTLRVRFT